MLLPFLLTQHKVWRNCKMRIFTVAREYREFCFVAGFFLETVDLRRNVVNNMRVGKFFTSATRDNNLSLKQFKVAHASRFRYGRNKTAVGAVAG